MNDAVCRKSQVQEFMDPAFSTSSKIPILWLQVSANPLSVLM